ncbi:Uncharacterized protein SCF082_LOCUS10766, partial [Durusdinium trenchii]
EMWVYTPEGRMIRQDDLTQDTLAAKATKECDTAMFQALIGENGPLCCGALPSVKSIPESGAKKIFQALDEERKQVEKRKTEKRKKEEESKELEPKTPEEEANLKLQAALERATKARKLSIQLKGVDYAKELSDQRLKNAASMESLYMELNGILTSQPVDRKKMKAVLAQLEQKNVWFEKAEVDQSEEPTPVSVSTLLPHEVFHALHEIGGDQVWEKVNEAIAQLTAWSLKHAMSGIAPSTGFYDEPLEKGSFRLEMSGKPLAGGHKLCYLAFKADLKSRHECHLFSKNYQCKECCDRCGAIRPTTSEHHPMTYKDFGPGAPYAATSTSHSEYLETCDRVSPWSAISGWQLETVTFDTMHVIWLGIARDPFPGTFTSMGVSLQS